MLNYLSGTPEELGRAKNKKREQRKEKRKEKREQRKENKPVAKIAVAPARASFLLAVQKNALKLATRLARAYRKDRTRVEAWWNKLGGDVDALKKSIEKGSNEKLGAVGVTAAATAFAAATPIIIAATKLMKELKTDQPGDDAEDGGFFKKALNAIKGDRGIEKCTAELPEGTDAALIRTTPESPEGEGEGSNTMLLVGGAAVIAAFALSR